jgi:hypothetical protein
MGFSHDEIFGLKGEMPFRRLSNTQKEDIINQLV